MWTVHPRENITADGTRVVYTLRRGPLEAPIELFSSAVVPEAAVP